MTAAAAVELVFDLSVGGVVSLADELRLVHASWRRDPQASGQLSVVLGQQLARSCDQHSIGYPLPQLLRLR